MEIIFKNTKERLDKFLHQKFSTLSRNEIQKLIKSGLVLVNQKTALKPSLVLKTGDKIETEEKVFKKSKPDDLKPEPKIPLKIVYEDKDLIVINKPAGLITHPTDKIREGTLANALLARYPKLKSVGENPLRPGIVHRLDKDTSGLIIIPKNQKSFLFIKQQFLDHSLEKKYLCLIDGIPTKKYGVIEYPIRPSAKNRLKKVAVKRLAEIKKSVRSAVTKYKVIKTFGQKFALLEVSPLTGRTHQIRVHFSAIGHPIIGDKLYGPKTASLLDRQFLHAFYLKFTTPSGKKIELKLNLPKDLENFLKKIIS